VKNPFADRSFRPDRETLRALVRTRHMQRALAAARNLDRPLMRTSISFLTTTAATAPAAVQAGAAPHALDVLGLDRAQRAIYLVEKAAGALPLVHVVHLHGEHAGRLIVLRSWYEGSPAGVAARLGARVRDLAASLCSLDPVEPDAWILSTRVVQRRALRIPGGGPPIRKFALQLAVEPLVAGPDARTGRATVTAYLRPRATLDKVWLIPGEPLALARVAFVGVPSDVGHARYTAVVTSRPLH
jgi:hypothetical protein